MVGVVNRDGVLALSKRLAAGGGDRDDRDLSPKWPRGEDNSRESRRIGVSAEPSISERLRSRRVEATLSTGGFRVRSVVRAAPTSGDSRSGRGANSRAADSPSWYTPSRSVCRSDRDASRTPRARPQVSVDVAVRPHEAFRLYHLLRVLSGVRQVLCICRQSLTSCRDSIERSLGPELAGIAARSRRGSRTSSRSVCRPRL